MGWAVGICHFVFGSNLDQYKTQKNACDACFEEFFGHFFVVLIGRKLNEYVIKLFKVFCQH